MEIREQVMHLCENAKKASAALSASSGAQRNAALLCMRDALLEDTAHILCENEKDLAKAEENGVSVPMRDRLRLTEKRIADIADALGSLADAPDPLGGGAVFTRPNGLVIRKIAVPLGVVGMIYEARPNVTADAAGLCIKSGNAVVLRGGKEALRSNIAIADALRRGISAAGFDENAVCLIKEPSRESAAALMTMRGLIDVLIPRGGKGLIASVVENATVPVIETGAGNCHLYVDADADTAMAVTVAMNAKTQRPAVCNAIETLLVHRDIAEAFLPAFRKASDTIPVDLRGCARTQAILPGISAASEEDYATEFDDNILAVRVVDSVDEAIAHINRYNTGHSEAILTNSLENARKFQTEVNAACVYVNASTRFTDGGEFGFGAEIGISTQKLHIRGPMGITALTTQKYLIEGNGQIRK